MEKSNKIEEIVKSVVAAGDVTTVIGEPFVTPGGATVIPVGTSVTAVLTGSGEYGEVGLFSGNKTYPKTGGGGGISSVKPYGFIVERGKKIEFVSCPNGFGEKLLCEVLNFLKDEKQ